MGDATRKTASEKCTRDLGFLTYVMPLELKLNWGKAICELAVKSAVSELHWSRVLKMVLHHRTKTLLFVLESVVRVIGECIQ